MARLTPFGQAVRKHRVDRDETQSDIAHAVGVSVAFWSGIETGKKNISGDLLEKLSRHLGLPPEQASNLRHLADVSRAEVKINMQKLSNPSRELVLGFARKFEDGGLSEQQMARLRDILETED
ncbi:helix-turn-helix domain-containing protein [Thiobaca trueperi]|uniref:DNA-binding XRE family transcriptional regulator n=1 Tax=Thiobaca trueperi TaxID=127458 RepID=A0A4R3MX90_9GAMM|nr:helix-turn-helix domain-containing protein [Thiobaca trueperi]TCT21210.1 DNA-binding XRE family transcriptional regulator [Thiobaca trueperi]